MNPAVTRPQRASEQPQPHSRVVAGVLLGAVGVLLAVVICTPIALSSQELIAWAAARTGLGLPAPWPVLVFLALDAAAGVCVLLTVYCAWRGEPAGTFGLLVWCFAAGSAFANWRHGHTPGAPPDAVWFFPAMSLAGPALLEAVLGRLRRWVQRDTGRRGRATPTFGWRRWTPGLGALRDTYGAYRTALLLGIDTVDAAVTAYHQLCPDGTLRIAAALRAHHAATTQPTAQPTAQPNAQPTTQPAGRAQPPAGTRHQPADLRRRIPANPSAYQRWRAVWHDLQHNHTDPRVIADTHQISLRQLQFIRRAGQAGLLDSATPPTPERPERRTP